MGMNDKLTTIWVGKDRKKAKLKERMGMKKYGDAIMSSGAIILNKKKTSGYAVSVPTRLMKNKVKKKIVGRRLGVTKGGDWISRETQVF